MKSSAGFTLIELLVVIAIIGILGSIAYPSFQAHILKARRGDAKAELIKAQMKQTSLHILNPSYTSTSALVGLPASDEYYTFSIESAATTTYLMKAKAKGSQINDESTCHELYIDQDSKHTSDGLTTSNDNCW